MVSKVIHPSPKYIHWAWLVGTAQNGPLQQKALLKMLLMIHTQAYVLHYHCRLALLCQEVRTMMGWFSNIYIFFTFIYESLLLLYFNTQECPVQWKRLSRFFGCISTSQAVVAGQDHEQTPIVVLFPKLPYVPVGRKSQGSR